MHPILPFLSKVSTCIALTALCTAITAQAQFATGNVIVLQVGDGSAPLTNASAPIFLKEYNTTTAAQASPVHSIAIPITGTHRLVVSGSATSEGHLALSADSLRLTLPGYDTTSGLASVSGTTSAAVARVIDTVSMLGIPGRVAATTIQYSANSFRSAVRGTGENYYGAGTGATGLGGVYYFGNTTTATAIQTTVNNVRVANTFNGNLYFSTGSGTLGIYKITGLPVTAATPVSIIPTGTGSSPYGFAINPTETVAYVADDRTTVAGGIQKWVYSGGAWGATPAYTFSVGLGNGTRSVAVDWSGTYPAIYAVTTDNRLVKFIDTNASVTYITLATGAANTAFRSVAFAPKTTLACTNPVLAATATPYTCIAKGTATISITSGTTPTTWSWTGPGTFTATTQNITGLMPGTYIVTATTPGGCTGTTTAVITDNTTPITATVTAGSPTTICMGDTVLLTAATGAGYTYQWNNGSAPITGAIGATYQATATGAYIVTITSGINCTATSTATNITVNPKPLIFVTKVSPDTMCAGNPIILKANSVPGYIYHWTFGNILLPQSDSTLNVSAALFGFTPAYFIIRAVITNQFGCTDSSATITTIVYPLPIPTITNAGGVLSTDPFATYQWYLNANPIPGATSQNYTPLVNGIYTVMVTNTYGCSATSFPETVTGVGIASITLAGGIAIYPNPATEFVNIEAPVPVNVILKDIQGRTVITAQTARQISLAGLQSGLYMISVYTADGRLLTTQRLMKTQ